MLIKTLSIVAVITVAAIGALTEPIMTTSGGFWGPVGSVSSSAATVGPGGGLVGPGGGLVGPQA